LDVGRFTDEAFWDEYWATLPLPTRIGKSQNALVEQLTNVLDEFLASDRPLRVLEVGGAPGQYAAYLHERHGHRVTVYDSSPVGCEKARENLRLLGVPAAVVEGDLFQPPPELGTFDAVYSLGLIEHFADVTAAVRAHVRLLMAGGLLLLGAPNLAGVNAPLMRRLSPLFLSKHHVEATYESTWDRFEAELGLRRLFRGYLGGFDPAMFWRCESPRLGDRVLHQVLWYSGKALDWRRLRGVRRINGRRWSTYLMGVYRVPGAAAARQMPK
jgi:2-polyprenyl-6-hydroxyphenyl methylase/3-demethylubiquinone-9 3-methyltransferase